VIAKEKTMFLIEYDDGLNLLVGPKGDWRRFEYGGFDFYSVVQLSDWEPIVLAIAERLGLDVELCIARIAEGRSAQAEFSSFLDELADDRNALYYDLERNVYLIDEIRRIASDYRNVKVAREAKKIHTKRRRAQFNQIRDDLVLKLLAAGRAYVCAKDSCSVNSNLTVDHIIALSKGGTDDLVNLQFLCGPHNSEKGDR
jgi:5-methylcytosine-specific restriction endonuclease McrA